MYLQAQKAASHLVVIAATMSLFAAALAGAQAAPVLVFGDVTIDSFTQARHPSLDYGVNGVFAHDPAAVTLPAGDLTKVEAFIDPGDDAGWFDFDRGTPTSLSTAFASALINGAGFAGVGVSTTFDSVGFGDLTAEAEFSQTVKNTGGAGRVSLTYHIPLIEIATVGNRYNGEVGFVAASMVADRSNSLGQLVETLALFDYRLAFDYTKPPTTAAIQTFTASDDLLKDSGGLVDVDPDCLLASCVTGKKILPFSVTKTIPNVDPGDELSFRYVMFTTLTAGREGGGHVLYGDPFEITTGGEEQFFRFSVDDVTAVPEPGTALLTMLGIAWAIKRRRCFR